jgi:guanylate kinase
VTKNARHAYHAAHDFMLDIQSLEPRLHGLLIGRAERKAKTPTATAAGSGGQTEISPRTPPSAAYLDDVRGPPYQGAMSNTVSDTPHAFRHIFVVSGPSGSGKGSIMDGVLKSTSLSRVVTYATRPKRPSERDGVDYNFIAPAVFERLVEQGEIVEKVQVYQDYYYGSPRLQHDPTGPDRLIELDPEGHRTYLTAHSPHLTGIFLLPPSLDELRRRIEARHRETNLEARLRAAIEQLTCAREYDYIVVNADLARACETVTAIVRATQQRLLQDSLVGLAESLRKQWNASAA